MQSSGEQHHPPGVRSRRRDDGSGQAVKCSVASEDDHALLDRPTCSSSYPIRWRPRADHGQKRGRRKDQSSKRGLTNQRPLQKRFPINRGHVLQRRSSFGVSASPITFCRTEGSSAQPLTGEFSIGTSGENSSGDHTAQRMALLAGSRFSRVVLVGDLGARVSGHGSRRKAWCLARVLPILHVGMR